MNISVLKRIIIFNLKDAKFLCACVCNASQPRVIRRTGLGGWDGEISSIVVVQYPYTSHHNNIDWHHSYKIVSVRRYTFMMTIITSIMSTRSCLDHRQPTNWTDKSHTLVRRALMTPNDMNARVWKWQNDCLWQQNVTMDMDKKERMVMTRMWTWSVCACVYSQIQKWDRRRPHTKTNSNCDPAWWTRSDEP